MGKGGIVFYFWGADATEKGSLGPNTVVNSNQICLTADISCFINGESGRTGVGLRYSCNDSDWKQVFCFFRPGASFFRLKFPFPVFSALLYPPLSQTQPEYVQLKSNADFSFASPPLCRNSALAVTYQPP